VAYSVYCNLAKTQAEFENGPIPIRVTYQDRDDALAYAKLANEGGTETAWLIEGDDGTRLDAKAIAHEVWLRGEALVGRPKVR
jgi:hypothetical protein